MFNFFSEINDLLQVPLSNTSSKYKYVNLSGKAIYIQGYLDVLSFTTEQIVLKLKGGELFIKGQNLNIREFNPSSLVVEGRIVIVEEVGGHSDV